jgi:sugar phosphate isomerase/epimerase
MLKVAQQVTQVYPQCSLCLDVGHVHAYAKEPLQEWMEQLQGHIGHFHLHDNLGDEDSHWALGEGNIDCPWLMGVLKQQYMQGCCTIENTKFKSCEKSLQYLQQYGILEKTGFASHKQTLS